MRWCILLCLVLSACGGQSASNTIADSAISTATALEQTLPAECATSAVKTQIQAIKTQITAISQACEAEKAQIRSDKIKWQTAFWGLLVAVAVFVLRKVIK